ncbi:amidohydrolase family protein [Anaerostipes sp.]|uniref:amidohydrolase family protein n=1 Tax=Anaerostipes sp. TaxID=1872530 RepID=UPI0025B944BE|nr:amidohydrolase family protein [Anaerostipes sp.]MBS7008535.1 amidohydrolase family protein [Anaerostipes sp.]
MKNFALKGDIIFTPSPEKFETYRDSYLVCEDGRVSGIWKELPEKFSGIRVEDYSGKLIFPGLCDLHIHAPQYSFRGMGMDMELLSWLETYTFPEESKYKDIEYAKKAYEIFTEDLRQSATARVNVFGTIHRDATVLLMDMLEEAGIRGFAGKVNMDRNCPDFYREKDAQTSVKDTREWYESVKGRTGIRPILTPRFLPACSDSLMEQLKDFQKETGIYLQSHLSENPGEVEWVKDLAPTSEFYGDAYDRFELFGNHGKTVMAHCVYSGAEERALMKKRGVYAAHCPQSNLNLSSGIAPVRVMMEEGLHVGLGTDIAGGASLSILRAMTDAVQVSKMYWRYLDQDKKPLSASEAFYLGTKGGGSFFGKAGSFEPDCEFDAVILDDVTIRTALDPDIEQRMERAMYLSQNEHIMAKYIGGQKVFCR